MKKHFNDGTFRETKHMVKAIALALCFVLLFTSFDTAVFAAEDAEVFESEIELVEESDDIEEQPVEYAETEEPIDDQMILESLLLEVEEVPFEQSITVDDVVITVSADAGVFPEGASMSVRKVTISEENEVAEAIDEVRDNDKKVALSYTFDITVCDMDGNEIEPDTEKGSVKVTFKMAEIANINLETEVYHLEETDGGLNVENLDVKSDEGEADEVAVETTGFSFYTVEFTYNELQYVLEGDEKVELTTILDAVGIKENGEISKVEGSDDELFKPIFDDDENVWYIESVKAFSTEEWLKVTIDGIEYEIVVTDNQAPGEWSKLLTALSGSTPSSVENQFEVSSDEDGIIIKLLADFTAGDGATTLTVSGAKKLDLNGHVINANGKSMRVLTIPSGAELTLEDSDTTASHEGYIDADDIWHLGTGTGTSQAIAGGIITGGKVAGDNSGGISDGGGVLVTGTLKMYGGSISGNTISYTNYGCGGGGIAVADSGEFEMHGGYITYNKAGNGGGVRTHKGIFNMYDDAVISNCKAAASGGGVFVENATFNMYGGVIEKCEAESGQYGNGGGVFTHTDSTFTMTGGAIKNNTAAGNGAGVHNNLGTVTLGGKARITNNMRGTDYNNLYLPSNQTVQISDTSPTTGMSVHVTLENENGTGKVTGTSGTDQYAQYFGSDKLSNGVVAKGGFVQIVSKSNIVASVNHNDQYIYYDSLQNAINAAGTEDEVQLFRDIQEDISVSTDKNITLDLYGKVLKGTGEKSTITVSPGATLTLCDSRADVVHYYKYNSNGAWTWDDSAIDGAITVEEISDSTATGTPIILKGGAITGGVGNLSGSFAYGGGIFNCGNLKIDGGNIVGNGGSNYGGGIYSIVTIELDGGNIVGNYAITHGGGVYISKTTEIESQFVMNDGQIIYNAAGDQAGGVYLNSGGFDLKCGSISHNHAQNLGGGVTCLNGTMKMYGGEISYNKTFGTGSSYGFGGGVHNMETMYLYGGCINNNSANYGGGIFNGYEGNPGTLTLTDGIVTENNANSYIGGVYHSSGSISFGGTTQIKGNTKGADCQNFYLYPNTLFTIVGGDDAPKTGMSIGVTPNAEVMTAISNANGTDYSQYFSSDNDAFSIYYKSDNKLYLAHSSTVTIDLNGGSYLAGSSALADWTYDSTSKKYSKKGSKVPLPDAPTAPAFMKFKGWKYNSNLYDAGTEIVFENTETRTYTAEYVNIGSSIKTFATPGELIDPDCFALWYGHTGVAQKVYFGGMPWYIVGKDSADGSLVLMSAPGNFDSSTFGSSTIYSSSAVRNYLTTTALGKFTTAEQNMMQGLSSVGGDKLYLASGAYLQQCVAVGSDDKLYVSVLPNYATPGSPYTSGNWFWLRSSYIDQGTSYVLIGYPGHSTGTQGIHFVAPNQVLGILPAMNLNLSSVLFASSAPVASASTTFDDGMNFRIVAGNKIGSSAMCTESKVSVTKGEDAGDLYLYVQGKDTTSDWVWSTKITENCSYDVSGIHSGADLSECVIWLETLNEDDRLAYAKEASATSPYTVTLNNNGGTGGIESVEATLYSDMPEVSTLPTKDGAIFIGYFDEETGGTRYYNADGSSAKKWDKFSDATLYAHWHEHSWTILAGTGTDSNVLYAVCSEPECEYYGTTEDVTNALSISVNAPSRTLTYDGNDFVASITDTDSKWEQMFEILPDIQYGYKEFGMEAASYSSVPDTKDAGYYKASITEGEKTAYVEYQIAKKTVTLSVTMDNYQVNSQPSDPSVSGGPDGAAYDYKFKKKGADDSTYSDDVPKSPWGDYTVKATYAGDKNHDSATATCNFQITPKERPETIRVTMFGYDFGQDTAPTPYITPSAGELAEKPTVTYMYSQGGLKPWTGDTSALDAGIYDMVAVIGATDSYDEYTTDAASFNVHKGEWKVTAPTARTLTYNGNAQELVNAGSAEGEQLWYSFDRTNYFENIPAATDSGIYNVYYKVDEDTNHNEYTCDAPIRVTINNADWKVTVPVAKTQTFTGEEQALIDPGTVKDVNGSDVLYKMEYSLTTEDEDFSTDIPKAGNIGPYTVYYRVKGDKNYNEYATQSVMAAIVPEAGIWCADIPDQVYTGKAIKPAIDVYSDGTLLKLGTDYTIGYSNNREAADIYAENPKTHKPVPPTITITGKGNYKNTKIVRTFTIEKYSLDGENSGVSAKIDPTTVSYTKKPIKLSPVVTLNGKKLKMGTDYILSTEADGSCEVKTLTKKGTHKLYVVGKGNYSGSIRYTFIITDLKVSIGKIGNQPYNNGEEVKPSVIIKNGRSDVTDKFDITYGNNTEIGTATVIITAKPGTEFSGSKSATFKIEGTSIAKAVLGADGKGKIADYIYSGNPCMPKLNLFLSDTELTEGKDYTVEYTNNVNAGTATVMVTGKGAYTGTKKFTFKINKYDAGVDAGGLIKVNNGVNISVKYEKGGVTPKVSVSFGGQILEEKKDYTLSYANNKAVADEDAQNTKGKSIAPTITVTFKGNFSGKRLKTFKISNKDIKECTLIVADKAYSTKKNAWKQTKITITDVNGKRLAAKTDYNPNVRYFSDISCDDAYELTEATLPTDKYPDGKGWVYVKATAAETSKNYEGYVIGRYYVSGINIASVKAVIADQVYTGKEICPTEDMVTVTIKVGKETRTLSAGDPTNPNDGDYTVVPGSYTKNINKGTASLTIRGNGEYFGTKAVKFKIVNKSFEWWEKLNL